MTTTLKKAFEKAPELPESEQEAFGRFLLDELEFISAVQQGAHAADEGKVIPVEDVGKMIANLEI
jgi:predicted transcriptional regulator